MVSKFALLFSFVLASAALAAPSPRLEARLARRRANRQSQPSNRVDTPADAVSNSGYSPNWSGAVLYDDRGTFTTVTGTFTVPTPIGSDGSAAAWVGIDGDTCRSAILQTGIDFTISNGEAWYDGERPWYEWYPDYSYDFSGITIGSGDLIQAMVIASSTTSGQAVIENLTTGQTVMVELSSSSSLCEQDAKWIVEDYEEGGIQVPFVDFGKIEFASAATSGPTGLSYTPDGAPTIVIEQHNKMLTSVTTSGDTVTIMYV